MCFPYHKIAQEPSIKYRLKVCFVMSHLSALGAGIDIFAFRIFYLTIHMN